VSTTEELLGRNSSGFGIEIREYGRRDPQLALSSLASGGRSVGIVRSRTKATDLLLYSGQFFFMSLSSLVKVSLKLTVLSLGEAKEAQDGQLLKWTDWTYVNEHTAHGNELTGSSTSEIYKENADVTLVGIR
jgi:hypothetical protein